MKKGLSMKDTKDVLPNSFTNYHEVADTILGYFKKSARNFYNIGKQLKKVKEFQVNKESEQEVVDLEYDALIEMLPFEKPTANKFIQIADDSFIKDYLDIVPSSYNTMYDLVGLTQATWDYLEEQGMNSFSTLAWVKSKKLDFAKSTKVEEVTEDDKSDATDDTPIAPPTSGGSSTASEDEVSEDTKSEEDDTSCPTYGDISDDESEDEDDTPNEDGDIIITSDDGDTIVVTSEDEDSSDDDEEDTMKFFEELAGKDFTSPSTHSLISISVDDAKVKGNSELSALIEKLSVLAEQFAEIDGVEVDMNDDLIVNIAPVKELEVA